MVMYEYCDDNVSMRQSIAVCRTERVTLYSVGICMNNRCYVSPWLCSNVPIKECKRSWGVIIPVKVPALLRTTAIWRG